MTKMTDAQKKAWLDNEAKRISDQYRKDRYRGESWHNRNMSKSTARVDFDGRWMFLWPKPLGNQDAPEEDLYHDSPGPKRS